MIITSAIKQSVSVSVLSTINSLPVNTDPQNFTNSAFLPNGDTDFNGTAYFQQVPVYGV